jgi:hypothetical protein
LSPLKAWPTLLKPLEETAGMRGRQEQIHGQILEQPRLTGRSSLYYRKDDDKNFSVRVMHLNGCGPQVRRI